MRNYRKKLIIWLFENSQHFYVTYFKRNHTAWKVSKQELLNYTKEINSKASLILEGKFLRDKELFF